MLEEDVLIIPYVLALLGDNPMQSEFACHIGLRGKYFCRICKVMGKDRASKSNAGSDSSTAPAPGTDTPVSVADSSDREGSDDGSQADEDASDTSGDSATAVHKKRKGKVIETYDQIRTRISAFIQVRLPF